ncbi:hypothetical protein M501DRAFT_997599 [Patellaria atrata CBS 101060]|uniref:Uncharacterized protein n=1 Tax=Patellaria atrata CBS 101060 TaxID=1346257 RepID=A0A9P4S5Z3_9PEZI|nr:hypothetical protein M501DRAFT_997599 [Patellaria atrata CBS 101060]
MPLISLFLLPRNCTSSLSIRAQSSNRYSFLYPSQTWTLTRNSGSYALSQAPPVSSPPENDSHRPSSTHNNSMVAPRGLCTQGIKERRKYLFRKIYVRTGYRPPVPSNAAIKSARPSPSQLLIDAISQADSSFGSPKSYFDPSKLSDTWAVRAGWTRSTSVNSARRLFPPTSPISLQSILASYIKSKGRKLESTVTLHPLPFETFLDSDGNPPALNDDQLLYLHRKGYTIKDLEIWSDILCSAPYSSAKTLLEHTHKRRGHYVDGGCPIPTFVYLILLRRNNISANALRLLVVYALKILGSTNQSNMIPRVQDEATTLMVISRLLRHAFRVWPPVIYDIATMFNESIGKTSKPNVEPLSRKRQARITLLFNRTLLLLSKRARERPYNTIEMQERAQFAILRRMAEYNPPLVISRIGYRAVIRVQLARKKTSQEIEWTKLKSRSWPPWKEEKTGVDADIGPEHGITRAGEVMRQMKEAGYGTRVWEEMASIYAGWDTDGSPTIQTRHLSHSIIDKRFNIWVARINATRTLEEAWAAFLAYEKSHSERVPDVYLAMFGKIYQDSIRSSKHTVEPDEKDQPLPGDGKEVIPAPISPQEKMYLESSPPSIHQLYLKMREQGIEASEHCLTFLIAHAESLQQGIEYMYQGKFRHKDKLITTLLSQEPRIVDKKEPKPWRGLLLSFIQLLSRFPYEYTGYTFDYSDEETVILGMTLRNRLPIVHAYHLVQRQLPKDRHAFNLVLRTLAMVSNTQLVHRSFDIPVVAIPLVARSMMRVLYDHMQLHTLEIDTEGFHYLCIGLENATLASIHLKEKTLESVPSIILSEADCVLSNGSRYIRHIFQAVVGNFNILKTEDSTDMLLELSTISTPLLRIPHPAVLHSYVRALGFLHDYEGILSLVQWLTLHNDDLQKELQASHNGYKQLRRMLTAIRVFLERSWKHWDDRKDAASDDLVLLIREVIDRSKRWGGWPTEDDVEYYVVQGRFTTSYGETSADL